MKILIHDTDEAQRAMEGHKVNKDASKKLRGLSMETDCIIFGIARTNHSDPELAGWFIPPAAFTILDQTTPS